MNLLNYTIHHHFPLTNLQSFGYQDKNGNIIIDKADNINDCRLSFGLIETDFGTVCKTN